MLLLYRPGAVAATENTLYCYEHVPILSESANSLFYDSNNISKYSTLTWSDDDKLTHSKAQIEGAVTRPLDPFYVLSCFDHRPIERIVWTIDQHTVYLVNTLTAVISLNVSKQLFCKTIHLPDVTETRRQ